MGFQQVEGGVAVPVQGVLWGLQGWLTTKGGPRWVLGHPAAAWRGVHGRQRAGYLLHLGCGWQLSEEFCSQMVTSLVTSDDPGLKEGDQLSSKWICAY